MNVFRHLGLFAFVFFIPVTNAGDAFKNLINEYLEKNYSIRTSKSGVDASIADKKFLNLPMTQILTSRLITLIII